MQTGRTWVSFYCFASPVWLAKVAAESGKPAGASDCERDGRLASSSTLCRFEQRAERQWGIAIHQELVAQFIASFAHPPEELVLDFDATDDPVHGHQAGRFFHGYYDRYCFLPLCVFCGQQLLVA